MALQLSPQQEQRIQAVVSAWGYVSTEEAIETALALMETAAAQDFEGEHEDLEGLLMEGLASNELPEEEFWNLVDRETNAMLAAHRLGPRP